MSREPDEPGGRRLLVGTFGSVVFHTCLLLLLTALTLDHDVRRESPLARDSGAKPQDEPRGSDYALVVTRETPERPVHERPLDVELAPAERPDASDRPRPPTAVAKSRIRDDRIPVEAMTPVELPRAAAAPKHSIDAPSKLSRQDASPSEPAPTFDEPVELPRSLRPPRREKSADASPSRPKAAAPRPAPRAAVASRARPPGAAAEAAASEAVGVTRDPTRQPAATSMASIAAPAASRRPFPEPDGPDEAGPEAIDGDVGPPEEPSRQEAVVPAARARSAPDRSRSEARRVAAARRLETEGGGGASTEGGPSAVDLAVSRPTAASPLAEAGGVASSTLPRPSTPTAGPVDALVTTDAIERATKSAEVTATSAGDAADVPAPSGAGRSRSRASRRSASAVVARNARGRGGASKDAAADAVADAALAAMLGGRKQGIDGSQGRLDAPAAVGASASPERADTAPKAGDHAVPDTAVAAFPSTSGESSPEDDGPVPSPRRGTRSPRSEPRQIVTARGPPGMGGAEDEPGPRPGLAGRPNRRPIDAELENDARFIARVEASALPVDGRVREVAAPFAPRRRRLEVMRGDGPADASRAGTEQAIERSLEFLARCQRPDGRWSLARFPGASSSDSGTIESDSAATGLALLCFLGAGYDHYGEEHADVVRLGLGFLRAVQRPDGDLYLPSDEPSNRSAWMYSHAIATMALCEAVGMTGDRILAESAQRACRFIETSQHEKRGGWRYAPGIGSDLSVSGWMLLALRSGQLAGMTVDPRCFERVRTLLDTAATTDDADRYAYNPYAPDTPEQRAGRRPSPAMTAVGLLMRLHTGWSRDDPRLARVADIVAAETATAGSSGRATRDCYAWYYAAQGLFHVGGEAWDRWYAPLHAQLLASQKTSGDQAGSWDPGGVTPDRWGGFGGRIYVTALHVLTLEVGYRHLPIYEVLSGP